MLHWWILDSEVETARDTDVNGYLNALASFTALLTSKPITWKNFKIFFFFYSPFQFLTLLCRFFKEWFFCLPKSSLALKGLFPTSLHIKVQQQPLHQIIYQFWGFHISTNELEWKIPLISSAAMFASCCEYSKFFAIYLLHDYQYYSLSKCPSSSFYFFAKTFTSQTSKDDTE